MPALATHLVEYTYLAYLALALPVTVYVAWTLHRNGRAFLVDAFQGDDALADSVNHLLVVGFYLVNVGWIVMTLRTHLSIVTARGAMELLAEKVGTVLFVLGVMHLVNVYLFSQYRRRALDRRAAGLGDTSFLTPREEGR
jgi:hypothetical protein